MGSTSHLRARRHTVLVVVALIAGLLTLVAAPGSAEPPGFTLTILHNNDGESQLVDAGSGLEDYGGAARFVALVKQQQAMATNPVTLSSGDNFLAGPEFSLSLDKGIPFYDTIVSEAIGYDAVNFGNHDFDFGPDVLADFIGGFTVPPPYLGANLDFSAEPELKALVDSGVIVPSTTLTAGSETIGVIGVNTPNLASISSPRGVKVDADVATVVQTEVDKLDAAGVEIIILTSHLQDIDNEIALAKELTGVDVIIAGGGDELLANAGDVLIPGDEPDSDYPEYPVVAKDKDGKDVRIVTTSGEYRYLGKLVVTFDGMGNVDTATGGPIRVSGVAPDAVTPDPTIQTTVIDPVEAGLAALDADVITTSTVALDGRRNSVRFRETNEGNLIADALLRSGRNLAAKYGAKYPDVALQNGGGIRNNTLIPAGPLSVLDTFDMVPFPNFVSVVSNVPASQFKEILENAVSRVDGLTGGTGRFAQIAGFMMVYDPSRPAQSVDDDGKVTSAGSRIRYVELNDGTVIVSNGALAATARPITIATIDFLARGGDQYPFRGLPFAVLGLSYQQAVQDYLATGIPINATNYPEGGEGRIRLSSKLAGSVNPNSGLWVLGGNDPFFFGDPGDVPFAGDWDCDGLDTPGLFRLSDGRVYLRNSNDSGVADIDFFFGNPNDIPLAGDFDGDGCDTVSVYRPSESKVFVVNELGTDGGGLGPAEFSFTFGNPGDDPFVGDFDGDGVDTVGLHRATTGRVYFRNSLDSGPATFDFIFGDPGDTFLAGDWDGNGTDTVGVVRGGTLLFRNSNTAGFAHGSVPFDNDINVPVVGRFGK